MTTIYIRADTPLPKRRRAEHYPTERALIRAALERYALEKGGEPGYILDPGAGDGRWGQAAKALYKNAHIAGVESRRVDEPDGFDYWLDDFDFLKFKIPFSFVRYGLICGNPPYGPKLDSGRRDERRRKILVPLAEFFIRIGFDLLAPGGRMIYLLPLQMQAGKDRYNNLWVTHPPTLVAVVSPRPSFGLNAKGRRGTNGTDYGLFVWDKTLDGACAGTPRRWASELFLYKPDGADIPTVGPQAYRSPADALPAPGEVVHVKWRPGRWSKATQHKTATYEGRDRWRIHGDVDGGGVYGDDRIEGWARIK